MTQVEGFDDFVVAASPRLLGSARLICGDRQIAEDLVQETLIRVCLHWSAIRDPASVTAYAYRTLVRLARRSARRLYHSREIPAGGDRELDRAGPAALSDDLADVDGAFATVRARLAALPTRQRQTLVLRYFADLSVETTAEIMQCSTGTVKSQTAKGLSALREQLSMNPTPAQVREQR